MAVRSLKARVEIEGEKEYKQAISELNTGNKVLASEMKKLQEQYKGNENSMQALKDKGDLLQRQLLQQKDKVEKLKEALANSARQTGESSKQTQEWQIKLNNAEAAQFKLENAIKENDKAIQEQTGDMKKEEVQTKSLGDQVDSLASKFGVHLPEQAKKALDGMKSFSAGTMVAMTAAVTAITAVITAVKNLNEMTIDAAKRADDLATQSMKSGLSVQELQQINYASPYLDVETSTFVNALERMPKVMNQANEQFQKYYEGLKQAQAQGKEFTGELGAQAKAFNDLGVTVVNADGSLRSANETFWDALRALDEMGESTEADVLANSLFGKSYADLKPLIQNTEEAQRLMNEALEEGYVLNEDQVAILHEVQDAQDKLTQTTQKQKDLIAVQWSPAVKSALELFTNLVDKAGKMLVDSGIVKNLASLVTNTIDLFKAASDLFGTMPDWMNPLKVLSDALSGIAYVIAGITDALNFINGLRIENWGSGMARTALGMNYGSGEASQIQRWKMNQQGTLQQYDEFYGRNASGTDNWRGGLTWVGESGKELVNLPRGSQVFSNQESEDMVGNMTMNITVNGVKQLDEVVDWFYSRRIRERMA